MYRVDVVFTIGIQRGMETILRCSIEIVVCVKKDVGGCRGVVGGMGEGDVWWRVGDDRGKNDWSE